MAAPSYGSQAAYYRTTAWRHLRQAALDRAGRRCEVCGRGGKGLVVHHQLGIRRDPDGQWLIALCAPCHNDVETLAQRGRHLTPLVASRIVGLARCKTTGDLTHAFNV